MWFKPLHNLSAWVILDTYKLIIKKMFESDLMHVVITKARHQSIKNKIDVIKLAKKLDKKQILSQKYLNLIVTVVTNKFI